MKFFIEQIAICPPNAEAARKLLEEMGAEFIHDTVMATGDVGDIQDTSNVANLSFDYNILKQAKEFEVLEYAEGFNWMEWYAPSVSHLGMHCTKGELLQWKEFFSARNIDIAQEVRTECHTNPFLVENGRKYHYCIFDTRQILGVDLKFIVRIEGE